MKTELIINMLTDEQILEIALGFSRPGTGINPIDFARAIIETNEQPDWDSLPAEANYVGIDADGTRVLYNKPPILVNDSYYTEGYAVGYILREPKLFKGPGVE